MVNVEGKFQNHSSCFCGENNTKQIQKPDTRILHFIAIGNKTFKLCNRMQQKICDRCEIIMNTAFSDDFMFVVGMGGVS